VDFLAVLPKRCIAGVECCLAKVGHRKAPLAVRSGATDDESTLGLHSLRIVVDEAACGESSFLVRNSGQPAVSRRWEGSVWNARTQCRVFRPQRKSTTFSAYQ
jgi:hypothetical protein